MATQGPKMVEIRDRSDDELMASLERYAETMQLPIRTGVTVDHVARDGELYRVRAGRIVVATGATHASTQGS